MKTDIANHSEVNAAILKWVRIARENLLFAVKRIGLSIAGMCFSGLLFLATLNLPVLSAAMPLSFIVMFVIGGLTLMGIAAYFQKRDELKSQMFRELFPLVAGSVGEISFTENPSLATCFPHEFLRDRVNGSCLFEIKCTTANTHVRIAVVLLVRSKGKKFIQQRFLTIHWLSTSVVSRHDVGFSTFTKPVFFQLPQSVPSDLFSRKFGEDGTRLPAVLYTSDDLSPNTSFDRLYEWMDKTALSCQSDDISFYSHGSFRHISIPVDSDPFALRSLPSDAILENEFLPRAKLLQNLIEIGRSLDETVSILQSVESKQATPHA